jgi:hypothetical protein
MIHDAAGFGINKDREILMAELNSGTVVNKRGMDSRDYIKYDDLVKFKKSIYAKWNCRTFKSAVRMGCTSEGQVP